VCHINWPYHAHLEVAVSYGACHTHLEVAVGCEAKTVASGAEILAHGRDEPHLPLESRHLVRLYNGDVMHYGTGMERHRMIRNVVEWLDQLPFS